MFRTIRKPNTGKDSIRVLVNFATLKQGGGQNVAMNFLYAVGSTPGLLDGFFIFYLVAKDSEPHRFLEKMGADNYRVFSRNPTIRILQEIFYGSLIVHRNNFDVIYSYFGYGQFFTRIPQICGAADSNLFFPEIDFWSQYRGLSLLKKRLVDIYRLSNIKRAHAVIFENAVMEERARKIYTLKRTKVILPSIAISDSSENKQFLSFRPGVARGLFLCGWQLNKNVFLIPEIAAVLKARGCDFQFILTAPLDGSENHRKFEELVRKYGVEELVSLIGPVGKDHLGDLYRSIDFVLLLSKLESFSNNIIEAWFYHRPLLISDELWAHSICGDAAIYVNRDSAEYISSKIMVLIEDEIMRTTVIENGRAALAGYPTIEERISQEMEYVRHVSKIY